MLIRKLIDLKGCCFDLFLFIYLFNIIYLLLTIQYNTNIILNFKASEIVILNKKSIKNINYHFFLIIIGCGCGEGEGEGWFIFLLEFDF